GFPWKFQGLSSRRSHTPGGNSGLDRLLQDACGLVWRGCDEVAPLVLAKPDGVGRTSLRGGLERDASTSGKRHLGHRNQQPTVGNIVHGGYAARADQAADEISGASLGSEIDWRRRAFISSARQLLIKRLAKMAALKPDEDQRIAVLLQRDGRHVGDV